MIGKRFMALVLVLCMVLGMMPVQAFAATGGTGTLTLNEAQQVNVENRQDWHYFAFTPEVTGVYEFKGTWATHWEEEELDVYGVLYNANPLTNSDAHLLDEDWESDEDYAFILEQTLGAGQTYWLATTMQEWIDVGSYEVSVTLKDTCDVLTAGGSASVSVGPNEEDWEYDEFVFVAPYDGTFIFYSTDDGGSYPRLAGYHEDHGEFEDEGSGCDYTGWENGFYVEITMNKGEACRLQAGSAYWEESASYTIHAYELVINSVSVGTKSMTHYDGNPYKRWKFTPSESGTYTVYSKMPNEEPEEWIEMYGFYWDPGHGAAFDGRHYYKDNYYFYQEVTLLAGGDYHFETEGDGTCKFVIKKSDSFTTMVEGESCTATIKTEGGCDWFTFVPEETAAYTFTSDSSRATWCELYDSMGNQLDFDGTYIYWTDNFRETRYLEAGETYYLRVFYEEYDDTGSFPVRVDRTPTLELDQPVDVSITDSEWRLFSFIPEVTALYEFYTVPGSNTTGFEHRGDMFERNWEWKNTSKQGDQAGEEETGLYMSDVLVAGEQYYLRVGRVNEDEGGELQVCLSYVDISAMELEESYADSITRSGEALTYSFTPEKDHTYVFWADWLTEHEDEGLDIIVYDDNFKNRMQGNWDVDWLDHEYTYEVKLKAGRTYYIDFYQFWDENILGDLNVGVTWEHNYGCGRCDECGLERPHSYVAVVTPPSCTAQGYTTYTCEICGSSYVDDYIAKTEHPFGEWTYYPDYVENCVSDGWQYRECADCGERIERTIPALGHVPGEAVEEGRIEPSCDSDGGYWEKVYCQREECGALVSSAYIVLEALGHVPGDPVQENYSGASCDRPGSYDSVTYCQREKCGAELERWTVGVPATGHKPGEAKWENEVAAGCVSKGGYDIVTRCETCNAILESEHKELDALGHDYRVTRVVEPTCTDSGFSVYTCSRCGDSYYDDYTDKVPHVYQVTQVVAPTCSAEGYSVYTCTGCGVSYQDDWTDMIPHNYESVKVVAPTCTERGYTVYECTECEFSYNGDFVPTVPHAYERAHVVEPTCTSQGYSVYTCTMCGASENREYVPTLPHNYVADKVVAATCTAKGYTVYKCSGCGVTENRDFTPMIPHDFEKTETVAPTCAEQGYSKYVCSMCGGTKRDDYVPSLPHSYGEGVVTAPTCSEMGYTTFTCTVCGHVNKTDYTAKVDHSYGEGVVTAPTCTARGYTTYTCLVCEADYVTDYVPMAPHSYGEAQIVAPTCTRGGYSVWACLVCGFEKTGDYTDPLPHNTGAGVVTAPTCKAEGYTTYTCADCGASWKDDYTSRTPHSYSAGTVHAPGCTTWGWTEYVCSVCGDTYQDYDTEPAGHKYSDGICTVCGDVEPECEHEFSWGMVHDCEEGGYEYRECTKCGMYEIVGYLPAGHIEDKGEWIEPTCTEQGYMLFHCQNCRQWFKDYFEPALGHESVPVAAVAPTCTETGLTAGTKCSRCGEVLTAQQVLPATGHSEIVLPAVEPTCTRTGATEGIKCAVCGAVLEAAETIPALGHAEVKDQGYSATCTIDGKTDGSHCERCGEILIAQETIPAPGHKIVVIPGYAATCEKDGLSDGRKCEVCGEILEEQAVIPATGHSYGDHICINCDELDPDYIPLSGVAGDDITWTFDPESGTLEFHGTGKMWDLEGPWIEFELETVEDYRVIHLYGYQIKYIIFHEGITGIGDCAFYDTYGMNDAVITLPSTLTHIGKAAFSYCHTSIPALPDGITFIGDYGLMRVTNTHIDLPDSLTELNPYVCFRAYSMSSIELPANLKVIREFALADCQVLTAVEIPDGTTTIEQRAFSGCLDLTSLTIPASVKNLGIEIIDTNHTSEEYCFALEFVKFEGDAPGMILPESGEGHAFYNTTIYYPGNNETWTAEAMDAIGENVTWIPYCDHVEEKIPGKAPTCEEAGLTEGVKCADCGEILVAQEIIPATGHSYEEHFCTVCGAKEPGYVVLNGKCGDDLYWTIDLETSTIHITGTGPMYDESFLNANFANTFAGLAEDQWPKHLVIDEGATTVGENMLYNYGVLETVSLPETIERIGEAAFGYTWADEINIPSSVREIGAYALSATDVKSVVIPEGVTEIQNSTFWHCYDLESVKLPSTLKSIGVGVFEGCSKLAQIEIPYGVESIGHGAFRGAAELKELTIPASVKTLGNCIVNWIEDPYALEKVTFMGDAPVMMEGGEAGTVSFYHTTAYYPGNNATWTEEAMAALGENVTWVPYYTECQHVEETIPGKAPTCTETGLTEGKKCSECGEILAVQEVIPALGHSYESVVTEPTCTEKGYTTHTCACGDSYVDSYVDADGHNQIIVPGTAATCTVPGVSVGFVCDVCGETLQEQTVIPAKGHTEVTVPGKAPTCIKSGLSDGSYCSVCQAEVKKQQTVPATGHTKVVDPAVAATCTEEGWTEGAHCSVCNSTITMQKKIPALGHTEVAVAGTPATCTESGLSDGTKCEVCGTALVAQQYIPMLGHNEVSDPAVEGTCQDTGLTEGAHCTVCGEITLPQQETPKGDHLFGNWTNVKLPTVEAEGESRRACVFCGKIETKVLEKLHENFTDVNKGDWYVNEVAWAVSIGVTTGTSADSFSPNNDCTRAQVVTFLWRAAGSPDPTSTNNPFTDVIEGAYYYDAVLWAVENGITTGMSATEFGTDSACTRGQVVTFLCRTAGSPAPSQSSNPFADVLATMYYYSAVLWAVEMGITQGMSATSFAPDGICNRAQIVTFLYRYINGTT